jgi:TolB-like protein
MHDFSGRSATAASLAIANHVRHFPVAAIDSELASRVFFGSFEVDLTSRELRKHGLRIRLAEKPFQILELLLERAGQVVTRQALRQKLWPATHVGYDHSLNTAVNTLREMLGDAAQNPRYIETLPRLGYRFICSVTRPQDTAPVAAKKLVVLPFENFSSDPEHEYFADGLSEEVISHLGQLDPRRLGVIARTSSIRYKRTNKSIVEVAAELRVNFILEGCVRHSGGSLRITAQLIEAADQTHLWSASFDRVLGDALSVQSDVAREIGAALSRELLSHKHAQHATTRQEILEPPRAAAASG